MNFTSSLRYLIFTLFVTLISTFSITGQNTVEVCQALQTLDNPGEVLGADNLRFDYQTEWDLSANVVEVEHLSCSSNGTNKLYGTLVSVNDPEAGWCFEAEFSEPLTWEEWSSQDFPTGFRDDLSLAGDNYINWQYSLLESGTLTGWGNWEGAQLDLSHSPANNYYAFQFGEAANSFNANIGGTFWTTGSGTIYDPSTEELTGVTSVPQSFYFDFAPCELLENVADCSGTIAETPCSINSIPSLDKESLSIYPNPNQGVFRISGEAAKDITTIALYDVTGKKVYEEQLNTSQDIDIDAQLLDPGCYHLIATSISHKFSTALIIE